MSLPPTLASPAARPIPPFPWPLPDVGVHWLDGGGGPERAKAGDIVTLDFVAWTADGTLWDTTFLRSRPQRYVLDGGRLPRGVDEALVGAAEGAHARVHLLADDAFGTGGVPGRVPARAAIVVELWVRAIAPAPPYVPARAAERRTVGGFEVADLVLGGGPALEAGAPVLLDVTTFSGGTLDATTTTRPEPVAMRWNEPPPPFAAALDGMRAGGVRQVHLADGVVIEVTAAQGTRDANGS